jgi:hypothetical protein
MPPLHPVHHGLADVSREVRALWDEMDLVRRSARSNGTPAPGPGGVTDHGHLSGLLDDDHPRYLTTARGDARYYTKAEVDALIDAITAGEMSGPDGAVDREWAVYDGTTGKVLGRGGVTSVEDETSVTVEPVDSKDLNMRAAEGKSTKLGRAGGPIRLGTLDGLVRADNGLLDAMPFYFDSTLRSVVAEDIEEIA